MFSLCFQLQWKQQSVSRPSCSDGGEPLEAQANQSQMSTGYLYKPFNNSQSSHYNSGCMVLWDAGLLMLYFILIQWKINYLIHLVRNAKNSKHQPKAKEEKKKGKRRGRERGGGGGERGEARALFLLSLLFLFSSLIFSSSCIFSIHIFHLHFMHLSSLYISYLCFLIFFVPFLLASPCISKFSCILSYYIL